MKQEEYIRELYAQYTRERWERTASNADSPDDLNNAIWLTLAECDFMELLNEEQQKLYDEIREKRSKIYETRLFQAFQGGYEAGKKEK